MYFYNCLPGERGGFPVLVMSLGEQGHQADHECGHNRRYRDVLSSYPAMTHP